MLAGCGRSAAEGEGKTPPPVPDRALFTAPLAGEKVPVLPVSMIIVSPPFSSDPLFAQRPAALQWADSLLQVALENRAPDINWVFPADLRAIAKRAPTVAPDPDKMGQSVMAAPRLDFMPDPLRSYARSLVAIAGGRHLLIPAAFAINPAAAGGVKADLSIVLTDVRNGRVVWRTLAVGEGATPAEAVADALVGMIPLPTGSE